MPVEPKLARMIIEAEKYGVTEPVITIAAIVQNGGLLGKDGDYHDFSYERNSDLLAELDIWNYLNRCFEEKKYINFKEQGLSKKKFDLTKTYIEKLKRALEGVIELSNEDDRSGILKSCIAGWISQIYYNEYSNEYLGEEDRVYRRINRRSCIPHFSLRPQFVVGKPENFNCKNPTYGDYTVNVISFVSIVEKEMIIELLPQKIQTSEYAIGYDETKDAVKIVKREYYKRYELSCEVYYSENHPQYRELKAEHEERERRMAIEKAARLAREEEIRRRQKYVKLGEKEYQVIYWKDKPIIEIDERTLFSVSEEEIFLENGTRVWITIDYVKITATISELRNKLEKARLNDIWKITQHEYERTKIGLNSILSNSDKLGKIELTKNNGGYGTESINVYVCMKLYHKEVSLTIVSDENLAKENTLEALQYLFKKYVEDSYGDRKFSHMKGKKKKVLTKEEEEVKGDFYSLVREMMQGLTVDNISENLEFLEEYYQELMPVVA